MRARNLIRGFVFLPWAIPTYIAALTWRWMFDDIFGVINFVIYSLPVINYSIPWLMDRNWAMISVIVATTWQGWPFFGIMLLAGLQTISKELYEAAAVDGASIWQRFVSITLPRLKSVILITVLLSTIWTFNQFEFIYPIFGNSRFYSLKKSNKK
jgi:multiple sugar transport system permease protein